MNGLLKCMSVVFVTMSMTALGQQARIKDLANIQGVRSNYLVGYGLVIGLAGTGDSGASLATNRAIANMLTRLGMKTGEDEVVSGNVAGVMVTADLPAFTRIGDKIDIKISTVGDASSLAGGTLVMTPLRAGDSEVYVVAQGAVAVGQANGSGTQVLTSARVPQGGTVEREFRPTLGRDGYLALSLKSPDFTTGARITDAINKHFRGFFAEAEDTATIRVNIPPLFKDKLVEFVAELEALTVTADVKATVVLNERTGTVVMGRDVVILPVAIAHGDLSIRIGDEGEEVRESVVGLNGATVGNLVETLNALGVKPGDLVGILQAVHSAGALKAELKFL